MSDELDLSRYEGSTPEPWDLDYGGSIFAGGRLIADVHSHDRNSEKQTEADRNLIVDTPRLLAEVRRLRAERDALRDSLYEILHYTGGADTPLDDEYVMDRAVRAIAGGQ